MRISHGTRQLIRAINALAFLVGIVAIVLLLVSFHFATREAGEVLCFVAVTGVVLTDSLIRRSAATPADGAARTD